MGERACQLYADREWLYGAVVEADYRQNRLAKGRWIAVLGFVAFELPTKIRPGAYPRAAGASQS